MNQRIFVWRDLDDSNLHIPKDDAETPDPYQTLGVTVDTSEEELRMAYRRLVAKWHPDRRDPFLGPWSTKQLQEINRAYDTIRQERGIGTD